MYRPCFPLEALINTGRLCSGGSALPCVTHLLCSYAALRLPFPPSTAFLRLSLERGLLGPARLFFAGLFDGPGRLFVRAGDVERVGEWSPGLRCTGLLPREGRGSQVPGSSSAHAPLSNTPPGPAFPAHDGTRRHGLPSSEALGHLGTLMFPGPHSFGSHARVPTHRRLCCQGRRKAHYRLVWVHPRRAGFAPAGRLFRISRSHRILPSFLTSLAWSHPKRIEVRNLCHGIAQQRGRALGLDLCHISQRRFHGAALEEMRTLCSRRTRRHVGTAKYVLPLPVGTTLRSMSVNESSLCDGSSCCGNSGSQRQACAACPANGNTWSFLSNVMLSYRSARAHEPVADTRVPTEAAATPLERLRKFLDTHGMAGKTGPGRSPSSSGSCMSG
jgi:hypothetical protein